MPFQVKYERIGDLKIVFRGKSWIKSTDVNGTGKILMNQNMSFQLI